MTIWLFSFSNSSSTRWLDKKLIIKHAPCRSWTRSLEKCDKILWKSFLQCLGLSFRGLLTLRRYTSLFVLTLFSLSSFQLYFHLWDPFLTDTLSAAQGGRTWQPFVGSKNGNGNFRQARIYNFCFKCVVFARDRKFAKLTQWNMQYIPCNSALLAQETLFLTQKGTFLAKDRDKS